MKATVRKWGNSLAVRLPQSIASDLNLEEGTTVALTIKDDALTLSPLRRRYRLSELLNGMSEDKRQAEIDWGEAEGREVW